MRAAQENNLTIQTTPFISRKDHFDPDIGSNPEFFNQAFLLEDNKVGEPVVTLESAFVMKVVDREKSYIPELDDIKQLVRSKSQEDKDRSFSITNPSHLLKKLPMGQSISSTLPKNLG